MSGDEAERIPYFGSGFGLLVGIGVVIEDPNVVYGNGIGEIDL